MNLTWLAAMASMGSNPEPSGLRNSRLSAAVRRLTTHGRRSTENAFAASVGGLPLAHRAPVKFCHHASSAKPSLTSVPSLGMMFLFLPWTVPTVISTPTREPMMEGALSVGARERTSTCRTDPTPPSSKK